MCLFVWIKGLSHLSEGAHLRLLTHFLSCFKSATLPHEVELFFVKCMFLTHVECGRQMRNDRNEM